MFKPISHAYKFGYMNYFCRRYAELPGDAMALNLAGILLLAFGISILVVLMEPSFKRRERPLGGNQDDLLLADQDHDQ